MSNAKAKAKPDTNKTADKAADATPQTDPAVASAEAKKEVAKGNTTVEAKAATSGTGVVDPKPPVPAAGTTVAPAVAPATVAAASDMGELRTFKLVTSAVVYGKKRSAGSNVSVTEDIHRELLANEAVDADWPDGVTPEH